MCVLAAADIYLILTEYLIYPIIEREREGEREW